MLKEWLMHVITKMEKKSDPTIARGAPLWLCNSG